MAAELIVPKPLIAGFIPLAEKLSAEKALTLDKVFGKVLQPFGYGLLRQSRGGLGIIFVKSVSCGGICGIIPAGAADGPDRRPVPDPAAGGLQR